MNNSIEKAIRLKLEHFKHQKNILEAHQTKAASIHFRNHMMERRKVANYSNEVDRLRSELSKTTLNHMTRELLDKRRKDLIKLGAQIY
jgi:hypothetical protein